MYEPSTRVTSGSYSEKTFLNFIRTLLLSNYPIKLFLFLIDFTFLGEKYSSNHNLIFIMSVSILLTEKIYFKNISSKLN